MGVCYSSINGKKKRVWEKEYGTDLKLRKGSSSDFFTFLSKLSGGGAVAAAEEGVLHRVPGRLSANGASRIASLYTQQGKKGTNQDAMIVWENFCTRSGMSTTFCGVFDGHGPYGHTVARKVRDALPLLLHAELEGKHDRNQTSDQENGNALEMTHFDEFKDEDKDELLDDEQNENLPEMHMPIKRSILKAFQIMDKELKLHSTLDCFCSGTTAVTLIMQDQDLIIGNVGDSRAVLATRDKDNALMAVQLTVDLKPNLPREAARIQKCEGRVFALQDEPEVARVWLPNSDSPGLAMARAFGDFCLKDFGLISMPDVYYHCITERDEFVILATDGVWDVLSNKEAVDIVDSAPSRGTAARALVDCATRAWRLKYPTSKMDDCAAVCLFLEHSSSPDTVNAPNIATKSPEQELSKVLAEEEPSEQESGNVLAEEEPDISIIDEAFQDAPVDGTKLSSEIVPVVEEVTEKLPERSLSQSKRSLAEFLSTAEDEEWSALEGITRVNSLLSIPRFLSWDKRSLSRRKWL
ncbi:probable phosphatase 2C 6 [Olea europaea subsp. europaea]|uniref:protein-serine/threonine phosphatase n=2 Tax=Olea europaea subsp. europaea TaxID=158383 RepID=A0A8S0RZY5_OLEEU|nr:probable phosphatase 2C 6 [Olea europaea subsp. europaea]